MGETFLIGWLYCGQASFTGIVAAQKGRPGAGWVLLGLLFPVVALLAAIGLPDPDRSTVSDDEFRAAAKKLDELKRRTDKWRPTQEKG